MKCAVFLIFLCISAQTKGQINASTNNIIIGIEQLLNQLLPEIVKFDERTLSSDASVYTDSLLKERFPDRNLLYSSWPVDQIIETDSLNNDLLVVAFGKLVNNEDMFAAVYCKPDTLFCFFRLDGNDWKEVGRHHLDSYVAFFEVEELNGKAGAEILASTAMNLNGNKWSRIFCYTEDDDKIRYAGDICTRFEYNKADSTVHEDYAGSWYMNKIRTIYAWHNDMLTPLRKSIMVMPESWSEPFITYLEYYENPKLEYGAEMQLIFRELINEKHPTENYSKYWEYFFELGRNLLGYNNPE